MYCEFFDALAYNVNCQVHSVVWSENFKTFKHNLNHGFTLISSLCISSTFNSCNSKLDFPPINSEIKNIIHFNYNWWLFKKKCKPLINTNQTDWIVNEICASIVYRVRKKIAIRVVFLKPIFFRLISCALYLSNISEYFFIFQKFVFLQLFPISISSIFMKF